MEQSLQELSKLEQLDTWTTMMWCRQRKNLRLLQPTSGIKVRTPPDTA